VNNSSLENQRNSALTNFRPQSTVLFVGEGLSYFRRSPKNRSLTNFNQYVLDSLGSQAKTIYEGFLANDFGSSDVYELNRNTVWRRHHLGYLELVAKIPYVKTFFTFARDGLLEEAIKKHRKERIHTINYLGTETGTEENEFDDINDEDICIVYILGKYGLCSKPYISTEKPDAIFRLDKAFVTLSDIAFGSSEYLSDSKLMGFPKFSEKRLRGKQVVCLGLDKANWELMSLINWIDNVIYRSGDDKYNHVNDVVQSKFMVATNSTYEVELHSRKSINIKSSRHEDNLLKTIRRLLRPIQKVRKSEKYHCFLCHSSKDKDALRSVYGALKNEGLDCWFDIDNLRNGDVLHEEIRDGINNSIVFIPFVTENLLKDESEGSFALNSEWTHILNSHSSKKLRAHIVPICSSGVKNKDARELFDRVVDGKFGSDLNQKKRDFWRKSKNNWFREKAIELEKLLDGTSVHLLIQAVERLI